MNIRIVIAGLLRTIKTTTTLDKTSYGPPLKDKNIEFLATSFKEFSHYQH